MTIALIVMPLLAAAQETAVTTYVFRFRTGSAMLHRDMNAGALDSLSAVISGHREDILSGVMPLHVDGHAATPEAARIRSNRVKSEMIVRDGLTEDCFVTRNHSGGGDYVTVRISVPPSGKAEKKAEAVVRKEETVPQVVETVPEKDEPSGNRTVTYVQPQADKASQSIAGINRDSHRFALRANLLRWATLTPCTLGSGSGSALLHGREESLVSGCYVQGRTVQLQTLRNRQAGRPDGWRHHCRLPAAAEQGTGS